MDVSKLIPLIYGLILITGQASAAEVAVNPSTHIVTQGESFNLNITINPLGTPIAGAQLNIAFNQSLFRVNSITEGNLLKQNGANTFFNSGTINNSLGAVANIYDTIIGPFSVSTPGTFIIINATPNSSAGSSWINLSNIIISDPNGIAVPLNVTNGSIIINITVNNVNRPPTFTSSTPANGSRFNETDIIQINATATDPDNDPLSYIIKIDNVQVSSSANYTWITNYNSSGYHDINISVSDGMATVTSMIKIYIHVHPRYDVNADGIVDIADLTIVAQHLNQIVIPPYPRYDVNMDGIVDITDLVIVGQHFGEVT